MYVRVWVCDCVCVTYNYAIFLLPDSCGILIIAIRLNTKHSPRKAATLVVVEQKYLKMPAASLTTRFQHHVRHSSKTPKIPSFVSRRCNQHPNPFLLIPFRCALSTA